MGNRNANFSIKCSVSSCTHHCRDKNYCSLEEIRVGCCDPTVTDSADTECASFKMGSKS